MGGARLGSETSLNFAWLVLAGLSLGAALLCSNPNYQWSEQRETPYGADFVQEWVAGDMLLNGAADDIYHAEAFSRWQHDPSRVGFEWPDETYYPAVYPPPYYCIVAPMAYLPYRQAVVLWLALMIAAYLCAAWLVERTPWPGKSLQARSATLTTALWSFGLLLPAMFAGCVMGQKGSCWLLIIVASWQLARCEKPFVAGFLFAILTIKPTLCCVLPIFMLLHRQWKFLGGLAFGSLCVWGGAALVVPASLWSDYWHVVAGTAGYQSHAGYRSGWSASLLTLLSVTGLPRAAILSLWVLSAAGLLFSLRRSARDQTTSHKLSDPELLLRILMCTALLSPHYYYYDLVWLLFPLKGLVESKPRRAFAYLGVLWIAMLGAQQFEDSWPLLSGVLVGLVLHTIFVRAKCGTSFACLISPKVAAKFTTV